MNTASDTSRRAKTGDVPGIRSVHTALMIERCKRQLSGNDEGAGVDEEDPEAKADVATDDAPPAVEEAPPPEEEPEDDIDRPMSSMTEQGAIEIEGFDDDFEEDNFLGDEMRDQYEDEEDGFDEVPEADQAPDLEAMINEQVSSS